MGITSQKKILNLINDLNDTNKSNRAIEELEELCKFSCENKDQLIKNGGIHALTIFKIL
jgi:hypothetical protein